MRHAAPGAVLSAAAILTFNLPAHAQQTDTGVAIAAISAGGIAGIGGHGSYGASLADPVTKHAAPFIDFSYSPLTSYAFTYGQNLTGKGLYTAGLFDLNAGVKVRFPTQSNWVPYFGLGAGLLHFASSTYQSGFSSTSTVRETNNEVAGNVSAGALYYISQHIGLELELKGYVARDYHFGRATAGLFFQFP